MSKDKEIKHEALVEKHTNDVIKTLLDDVKMVRTIWLEDGSMLEGCARVFKYEDLDTSKRLFYEFGYYDWNSNHWVWTNLFKEVETWPEDFLENEKYKDPQWLNHSNFHQHE